MAANDGSRARGRRRHSMLAAVCAAATLLGLAAAPAAASAAAPAPAASIADGAALAVIVPITAPADATGLISATSLAEYTATEPVGLLTRQLDAVIGTRAIIAIDPMVLASIRVLGTAAPASARAWLARFESASNERFALPYADADPTLYTQSTAGALPTALGFGFAIDPANFSEATSSPTSDPTTAAPTLPPTTPSPTAGPDAPVLLPTDTEVVEVAEGVPGIVWPRAGTVNETDIAALDSTALILNDADIADASAIGGVGTVDGERALIASTEVSAAVVAAARATDEAGWLSAVADARAAITAAVEPQTGANGVVVVALDRLGAADAARLPATLAALAADGGIRLTGLGELMVTEQPAPEAAIVPGSQDPARVATFDARLAAENAAGQFATAVADPALVTDPARLQTLALAGQGWVGRTDWPTVVGESTTAVDALLTSVRVVDSNFQFFADRSLLPISIQNDGAQAVTVLVTARPRTGLLDVDAESLELVVPAQSLATVEFAATAVSNGTVIVTVSMTSHLGVPIGTPATANVNVQAGWETPIVAGAAIAVGVLLVFGVVRTIRRVRASRREDATTNAATDAEPSDG
jgi:hypothetical protein